MVRWDCPTILCTIVGGMGATRSADSFSTIIQQPLFGTHGLNLVIRQNGEVILALDEILQEQGNFLEMITFDSQTRKKTRAGHCHAERLYILV
ncbi:hypothetical protein [Butyricicoccus pullicaecorum]|uniref:hypothetical protein n=1 Tax=Butyricicoccus pullicaecorum TaxID=501571 RepID=UPI0035211D0B